MNTMCERVASGVVGGKLDVDGALVVWYEAYGGLLRVSVLER
jgi:hypothetical protein